jgi:hypothetical protein
MSNFRMVCDVYTDSLVVVCGSGAPSFGAVPVVPLDMVMNEDKSDKWDGFKNKLH